MHEKNKETFKELLAEYNECKERMAEIDMQLAILDGACEACGCIAMSLPKRKEINGDFIQTYSVCVDCGTEIILGIE